MFYGANEATFAAARALRRNMTKAEVILWTKLRDKNLFRYKFRRQHPIDIFIVDFYNHKLKLVIEVDGEIHSDEESIKYDLSRTGQLENYGIKVIRFTNDQIIYHIDSVIPVIQKTITDLAPLQGGWGVKKP